jgi:alanyl-tRNA synthetase
LKKQVEDYLKEKVIQVKNELISRATTRNGIKLIKAVSKGSAEMMKNVAFQIRGEMKDSFVLVAGLVEDDKCTLMVMLSDDLVAEGYNAAQLVKEAAKHIQGGGGGQPHFATAGGKNPDGLTIAVDQIIETVGLK